MKEKYKSKEALIGILVASVVAVTLFYMISPKHWLALTIASPVPPVP